MMDERGKRLLVEILLVEDNPGDVRLTQIAMKEARLPTGCTSPTTARTRWSFLRREGTHAKARPARAGPAGPQPARRWTAARCCGR